MILSGPVTLIIISLSIIISRVCAFCICGYGCNLFTSTFNGETQYHLKDDHNCICCSLWVLDLVSHLEEGMYVGMFKDKVLRNMFRCKKCGKKKDWEKLHI
jgi:hypothetical protein